MFGIGSAYTGVKNKVEDLNITENMKKAGNFIVDTSKTVATKVYDKGVEIKENPNVQSAATTAKGGVVKAGSAVKNAVWGVFGWKSAAKESKKDESNNNQMGNNFQN